MRLLLNTESLDEELAIVHVAESKVGSIMVLLQLVALDALSEFAFADGYLPDELLGHQLVDVHIGLVLIHLECSHCMFLRVSDDHGDHNVWGANTVSLRQIFEH
jgi:hypothetical protein